MGRFKKSSRQHNKAKVGFVGPSKSGKTFTALRLAFRLAGPKGRVIVIDSENGRSQLYHGLEVDGIKWEWEYENLAPGQYSPQTYLAILQDAVREKPDVIVIDSLSHSWAGTGGALEQKDALDGRGGNSWANWRKIKPMVHKMFEAIVAAPIHVLCTMRSHTEWEVENNDQGKKAPVKVGLKPIVMPDTDYEFDVICTMDPQNTMTVEARGVPDFSGLVVTKPTGETFNPYVNWLTEGEAVETEDKFHAVVDGALTDRSQVATKPAISDNCDPGIKRIKELCRELGWPAQALRDIVVKRGGTKLADLSPRDLMQLLSKLEAKAAAQAAKEVF